MTKEPLSEQSEQINRDPLPLKSRQRLQWQCRRGMLELELFLNSFLEHDYDALTQDQKYYFEQLLTIIDPVLFDYLMGMQEADEPGLRDIIHTIRTAHQQRLYSHS